MRSLEAVKNRSPSWPHPASLIVWNKSGLAGKGYRLMRLICPNCDAQYEVDASAIPESGRDVQCSNCGNMWFVLPEGEVDVAEVAAFMSQKVQDSRAVATEAPAPVPPVAHPGGRSIRALAPSDETEFEDDEPQTATNLPPPRRALDESVLAVLREEAAREVAARKAEAQAGAGAGTKAARASDASEQDVLAGFMEAPAPAGVTPDAAPAPIAQADAVPSEDDDLGAPFVAVSEDHHPDDVPEAPADIAHETLPPFAETVAEGGHPELLGNTPPLAAAPVPDQAEVDALNALLDPPKPLPLGTGSATAQPRHALLPDIEEINSTLRPSDEGDQAALAPKADGSRKGFGLGFGLMIAAALLIVLSYVFAEDLAKLPGMNSWVAAYVNLIDGLRLELDQLLGQASRYLRGLLG